MKKLLLTCLATTLLSSLASAEVANPQVVNPSILTTFPYSMVGQLIFTSGASDYQGSGTAVYKRSVLTAAHNCWDVDNGWSTNVEFNRARSGAVDPTKQFYARRIYVFAGYQGSARKFGPDSVNAFASDLGGIRFRFALAGGSFAGWRADTTLLSDGAYKIALGYGAEVHTGDDMLYVEPQFGFSPVFGAFYESDFLTFEGGMSGGPVFVEVAPNDIRVTGVIVAGSESSGGIRALNAAASRFIQNYLRY